MNTILYTNNILRLCTKAPKLFQRGCCQAKLLAERLEKCDIVPNILCKAPKEMLNICYNNDQLDLGDELNPCQVGCAPKATWDACDTTFYMLAMLDPDTPSRSCPTDKFWLHWLVVNIPGPNFSYGETIAEYVGACPTEGSGLHRYIFLLYKQADQLCFSEEPKIPKTCTTGRIKFDLEKFTCKYKLTEASAINFFHAKWDESVPALLCQLGIKA